MLPCQASRVLVLKEAKGGSFDQHAHDGASECTLRKLTLPAYPGPRRGLQANRGVPHSTRTRQRQTHDLLVVTQDIKYSC